MQRYVRAAVNVLFKPLTMQQGPIHIQLEPTTYCNLNCSMCGRGDYVKASKHLSPELFRCILDQIHPQKITFSGLGEPFMHPQLLDMVSLAKEYGCSINTTTNCTLLTANRCEEIVRSGLDLIKISLDGATRQTYAAVRGENRFSEVLAGIQTLADAKKRLNSVKPFIRLNYVISRKNSHEILATVKLASRLGVDAVYFQPLELVGIEERQDRLVGNLTYEILHQQLLEAARYARTLPVKSNLERLLKDLPVYWKKYHLETMGMPKRRCILPWFSAYVTVDGWIRPCCSFSQTEANMGNLVTTDMARIWNDVPYQNFRKAMRAGKRPFPICANCVPQGIADIVRSIDILPGFLK